MKFFYFRINISWQNAAKLTFIENQIQICISIQSPTELQYWYSVLGTHLAQYCDEKRIRVHLDDLLGMANPWMFVGDEAPKKEMILVRKSINRYEPYLASINTLRGVFHLFAGNRKTQHFNQRSEWIEKDSKMAATLCRVLKTIAWNVNKFKTKRK